MANNNGSHIDPDTIQNILMIRRGAIGDILFTLPSYYMLRANFPNSRISFFVKDRYAQVLKGFPGLDEVLIIKNSALKSKSIRNIAKLSIDLLHTIHHNNYQLAVDFVGHGEQALLLWLCGIKHRWGSIKAKSPKPFRRRLYTNMFIRQLPDMHLIDQHLKLLEQGGLTMFPVKNQYVVPQNHLEKAKALFAEWGLSLQKPTIFIQPFTGDGVPGKIWPLERYISLAEYWNSQGLQIVFGGGPAEREKLKDIAVRFPVAAGRSDFLTSVGLTALSSVAVGGDTGLLHAALAAGTRTVMAIGPTNYRRVGPYRHPKWAVRPPTGNVIEDISVEQMIEATKAALQDARTKEP
jgi:ADP-heptose:LPS heptosyltransferase